MLFEVVRRLFEELTDRGVLASLPEDVQRAVILAYTRTSLSFKETRSTRRASAGVRSGEPRGAADASARLGPSVDFSSKQTDSLATEAAFLAYSDADVEHDFLRIVSLLRRNGAAPTQAPKRLLTRMRSRMRRAKPADPRWNGRLVVVVDELDKLTATADGVKALESILSGLKNLLTTRGVHFLFVAGPDLHDMALRESQRGSSVYESVFGWQLYVPCVWPAADDLLEAVVHASSGDARAPTSGTRNSATTCFKARGIPRPAPAGAQLRSSAGTATTRSSRSTPSTLAVSTSTQASSASFATSWRRTSPAASPSRSRSTRIGGALARTTSSTGSCARAAARSRWTSSCRRRRRRSTRTSCSRRTKVRELLDYLARTRHPPAGHRPCRPDVRRRRARRECGCVPRRRRHLRQARPFRALERARALRPRAADGRRGRAAVGRRGRARGRRRRPVRASPRSSGAAAWAASIARTTASPGARSR